MGYEKPQRLKIVAIVIAVAGVALVVSNSPTVIIGSENFFGDVLVTLSMFAWAAYTVLAKPMVDKYGPVRATLAALTTGTIIGLPFLIYPALSAGLQHPHLARLERPRSTPASWSRA